MKSLLIDNGTKHLGKLKGLLGENNLKTVKMFERYPPISDFDLIVLSGGSQQSVVSSPEIYKQEIGIIKNSNKPIIGVCLGCELIAYSFDLPLKKRSRPIRGNIEVDLANSFYQNLPKQINVFEAHSWVIAKTKDPIESLGKSKYGHEIIKYKEKCIFGFQFHPESRNKSTYGDEIFYQTLDYIKSTC